ncbi:MAG: transcriptional repressor [Candidatus Nealsonbacteria bacterium]|nr:transcriptional repressor [Candidatus Nealsonbacteria bacterium]
MITNNKNRGSIERITCQKEIILDYLKSVKTHPSAELIFREVRKKLPRISQGTVYRILNNLKNKDKVKAISVGGITHFDGDVSSHAHFICQECHNIYDIFDICQECQIIKEQKLKVGKIKNYQIYFYGYCKKCRAKMPRLPKKDSNRK